MNDEIKKYETIVGIFFFSGLIVTFVCVVGIIIAAVAGNTDLVILFGALTLVGAALLSVRMIAMKKLTSLRETEKQKAEKTNENVEE